MSVVETSQCSIHSFYYRPECSECLKIYKNTNNMYFRFFRECFNCKEIFQAKDLNRIYCFNKIKITCDDCGLEMFDSCNKNKILQCKSRACKSKLLKIKFIKNLKNCLQCNNNFNGIGKYCQKAVVKKCYTCKIPFVTSCSNITPNFCSKLCSDGGAKDLFKELNKVSQCKACGDNYTMKTSNDNYCHKEINIECHQCNESFKADCNLYTNKYCSKKCKNLGSAKVRSINLNVVRQCERCFEDFNAIDQKQKYCNKVKILECPICGLSFKNKCSPHYINTCSVKCGSVSRDSTNEKIKLSINEWINFEDWAKRFLEENNKKPTRVDFYLKFGRKSIPEDCKKFIKYSTKSESVLEGIIQQYLDGLNIRYTKNSFPIKNNKTRMQLDFVLLDYNIAIEVQDFWSHNKTEENSPFTYGIKKGPSYHKLKKELAFSQLNLKLIEVWEDEILSGEYKNIINSHMKK